MPTLDTTEGGGAATGTIGQADEVGMQRPSATARLVAFSFSPAYYRSVVLTMSSLNRLYAAIGHYTVLVRSLACYVAKIPVQGTCPLEKRAGSR